MPSSAAGARRWMPSSSSPVIPSTVPAAGSVSSWMRKNYRAKREQSLERLANKVAGKVVKYRRSVTLEPMNAYERHVIHTALQEVPGVTTYSTGVDPNRRVIVAFDREKK